MNAITLVFFLVLFVGFVLFIIYVLHSTTLLYLPQISSLENYPEGIYFYFLQALKYYLPENFSCYYNISTIHYPSFCIQENVENLSDICFYETLPSNITCPVTVANFTPEELNNFTAYGYNPINYSGIYFTLIGNRLIVFVNYSSYNESALEKIIRSFYENSYAISVPQFEFLSENLSHILSRIRVDAVLLSDYPDICVEYLEPKDGLTIRLNLSQNNCSPGYLTNVVANSTKYVKELDTLQYDTYLHLYLFPNPQTTQISLTTYLTSYFYEKLSNCTKIEEINMKYNLQKLGNCRQFSNLFYFYVARKTLVPGLVNFSYVITQKGRYTILEINYTLPVLYFRVKG
jgi:hypothetical protein